MSLSKQEFTDAGRSMLGRAQNTEILRITKIVVGDGSATQPSELWPLTALKSKKMDVVISTRRDYGQGTMLVEGSLRSDQAPSAFFLKEVGVMAHIGAEADRLYSVANAFAEPADYIDPAAPTIQVFKIKLIIDRIPTAQLVVQIGPSENVVGENIGADTVGPGWYKNAAGNVLKFKRLIIGTGMEIYEVPDYPNGDAIYVGIKTLHNDLDVYVPPSYPNLPAGALTFPTVQAAHDYILGFTIPTDKFARIHVGPNILTTAAPIVFSHPNSLQISLIGMPRIERTIAQIVGTGAPPGGAAKEIALTDQSGLAVGQPVYLYGCQPTWIGGAKITALRANVVTLSHYRKDTQPIFAPTDQTAGMKVKWYPSVLVNSDPNNPSLVPVLSCPNGIRSIENMCFEGCGYVLNITQGGMKNCQIIGRAGNEPQARRCLNQYQGFFGFSGEIVLSNGGWGVFSLGTITAFDQTVINGCTNGVQASGAGTAIGSITGNMPNTVVYLVHCSKGAFASGGGSFIGGSVIYCENDFGFHATALSVVSLGAAYGSVPQHNGTDLYAQGNSYIGYNRWGQAVPTCNPPAEVVGNQNAIIHVLNS